MNANIPSFQAYILPQYLYDDFEDKSPEKAIVFGTCGILGQAVLFHAMVENGGLRGRLPISAFVQELNTDPVLSLHDLELWDSMSYHPTIIKYDYLSMMRLKTILRNGQWYEGEYMFTIDWYGSHEAESAGDTGWKCHHIIKLDQGQYAAQPNNRILWFDPSFTVTKDPPKWNTAAQVYKVENKGKWTTSDKLMFYKTDEIIDENV